MKQTIRMIEQTISSERMLSVIRSLSAYHRLQASEAYRDAAKECRELLRGYGIPAEILSYPAVYGRRYMSQSAFREWNCAGARCRMVTPEDRVLADFGADPIGVFQKSFPCDYRDRPLDVVLLDKGSGPDAYKDLSLRGKAVFIRDDFNAYLDWAIRKGGAVGFLSDYVVENEGARTRREMWNARKYTSFWWTKEEDVKPFGFVLSPEEGERLAAQCRAVSAAHEADPSKPAFPQITCFVDAEFRDGTFENVSAFLPGETEEEVWILAHLCHPKPSANDNLSGVSAAAEAMKAIRDLTESGRLPTPKRGIRLLLVPEFTGTFAYIESQGDLRRVKAAVNLDMVGGKQELGYGPLTLSDVPDALPSFSGALGSLILEELRRDVPGFSPAYRLPLFNSAECGFVSGSDNFILSDPSVGIPTLMLSQWPDKFYHTNGDTPDVISPLLMKKASAFAASYAWFFAQLSLQDVRLVSTELLSRLQRRFVSVTARSDLSSPQQARALAFYTDVFSSSAETLIGFFDGTEKSACEKTVRALQSAMKRLRDGNLAFTEDKLPEEEAAIPGNAPIPVRLYRGPCGALDDYADTEEKREALRRYQTEGRPKLTDSALMELLIQYHIDGRHSVAEIAERVAYAVAGSDKDATETYIAMLVALGLCAWKEDVPQ
ncbi:MAG: DUF4910 domain-containing protein [Clostridiales Family XIII bacterium]|jgi:hypothetical protein|nr:DUF4910 domain-containing protein [Clostridiales Family XIII bacterium]